MALSWVLRDERVTSALIGASSLSQIKDNVKSVEQTSFSSEELQIKSLQKINLPKSSLGSGLIQTIINLYLGGKALLFYVSVLETVFSSSRLHQP